MRTDITMERVWTETFILWSETSEYREKVREAKGIINKALRQYTNPYVSYSGGKDSLCLLHLVLQEQNDVDIWHWDYGDTLMPRSIEKEILKNAREIGAKNIIIKKRGDNKHAREDYKFGYRHFFISLIQLKKEKGWDLGFIGIRKEESLRRERQYSHFFDKQSCYPILNFTWKDVWAYIVSNGISYPSIYDKYSKIYGWDKVRLVTFFDPEFDKFGSSNVDGVLMPEFRFEPLTRYQTD